MEKETMERIEEMTSDELKGQTQCFAQRLLYIYFFRHFTLTPSDSIQYHFTLNLQLIT